MKAAINGQTQSGIDSRILLKARSRRLQLHRRLVTDTDRRRDYRVEFSTGALSANLMCQVTVIVCSERSMEETGTIREALESTNTAHRKV